jgi:hypothetical protein
MQILMTTFQNPDENIRIRTLFFFNFMVNRCLYGVSGRNPKRDAGQ